MTAAVNDSTRLLPEPNPSNNVSDKESTRLIFYQQDDTIRINNTSEATRRSQRTPTSSASSSHTFGESHRWLIRMAGIFAIGSILALLKTPISPNHRNEPTTFNGDGGDWRNKFYPYYTVVVDELHQLDSRIEGTIYMFDQRGFESASLVWNQLANQHLPFAVIQVQNEQDVQYALPVLRQLYQQYGIPFRVRSGGHHKAGYSTVEDGIVLSLIRMNSIELDATTKRNTITTAAAPGSTVEAILGPAVLVQDILQKVLLPHGYAGVIGICGTVAESGFVLGGGMGFQSRRLGLGLDQVFGMRIVLVDGTVQDVNDNNHYSDLFWALRGAGGGNFGVVTQLRYRLYPAQDTQLITQVAVSLQDLPLVLQRMGYLNYHHQFPKELCVLMGEVRRDGDTNQILVNFMWFTLSPPSTPHNNNNNTIESVTPKFQSALLDIFHKTTTPTNWTITPISWSGTVQSKLHPQWAPPPWIKPYVQAWTGYMFYQTNTLDVWNAIIKQMSIILQECSYLSPHIELWGGAIANVPSNATAFFYRQAVYNVGVILYVPSNDNPATALASFHEQSSLVNAWWPNVVSQYLNGVYNNYPMASLDHRDYARAYWGDNLERLVRIKQKYDPTNVFQFEQSVPLQL